MDRRRRLPWAVQTFASALDRTLADPTAWLLGMAGFLLRGGLLLVLVPLIVLPTPVEMRLLLGNGLGSQGFSTGLLVAAFGSAIVLTLVLMLALYAVAWLEAWQFDRLFPPDAGVTVSPRRVAARVFSIQAMSVSALALAAVPLVLGAINVAYDELIRPSGAGLLYDRIVAGVQGQLLLLAAAIVIVEALSAIATRRALWRERGRLGAPSERRWRPLTALAGWVITIVVVGPALWALSVTWNAVRQQTGAQLVPDLAKLSPLIFVLAMVWAATLVLAGFASALRGALWGLQERR